MPTTTERTTRPTVETRNDPRMLAKLAVWRNDFQTPSAPLTVSSTTMAAEALRSLLPNTPVAIMIALSAHRR